MNQALIDKIMAAVDVNVKPMGKEFAVVDSYDSPHLYEFSFSIGTDQYNLMRSIELADGESPDIFDLVYYDRESIVNYMANFHTMSDDFLIELKQHYRELSELYTSTFGIENTEKEPEKLDDLVDSMYYDGDNYYLRAIIGQEKSDRKIILYVDPMLNIETQRFFFQRRYFLGHTQYNSFDEMKTGFINDYILKDVGKTPEELLQEQIELNKKDSE